MLNRLPIFFMLMLLPYAGEAVKPYARKVADPMLEPWRWRQEDAVDGLGTLCMDKASDGSFWFGGTQGIAHYDGHTVTRYPLTEDLLSKITNREGVPWVKTLLCTGEREVLALIGESLVLWSDGRWRVVIQDVGQSVFFDSLMRGKDGSYWLQVREGLWQISADFEDVAQIIKATRKTRVLSACIDPSGDVWLVKQITDDEFMLIQIPVDDGRPRREEQWISSSLPFDNNSSVARLVAGKDGKIWYADGSSGSGLEVFDPVEKEWLDTNDQAGEPGLYSLIMLQDGSIWAGGEGEILRRANSGNVALFTQLNLDLPLVPLTLFNFGDGRLWVVGRGGQVYSVDLAGKEWMTYEGLNFQCETEDGTQWFLSAIGDHVISYQPKSGEWLQYGAEDGVIERGFRLFASSHGLVWMTGEHQGRAGLCVFDGIAWQRFLHPEFGEWIEPNAVFEAMDGTIWLGAGGIRLPDANSGGALRYGVNDQREVKLLEHYAQPPLPYYGISFGQFPDGRMLIGSTIVHTFEPGDDVAPAFLSSPRDNTVSLSFDNEGTLWVAKEHSGVHQYSDGVWHHYEMEGALAGSLLPGLLVLKDGSVLAATDQGISRFDGQTWFGHAYPEEFGMSKRWSSMRESCDGSIWLNYSHNEMKQAAHLLSGLSVSRTTRHRPERRPPDTMITEYLKEVSQPGNAHVGWVGRDLWGDTPRELLQFSWRLNQGDWSPFSGATSRTFLELNDGSHVLEVRARDRYMNVDPTPARIEFAVIPPVWKQGWFQLLVGSLNVLIVSLIWVIIRNRERHILEQQAAREQHLVEVDQMKTSFFTNISHELNTPLSLISEPLKRVLDSDVSDKTRNRVSMALRNANRVSTLVSQIMDLRKLELGRMPMKFMEGDLCSFIRENVALLEPLAQRHEVAFRVEGMERCRGWYDADKLAKIIQNLVGNAIKYTPAQGEVVVRFTVDGRGWIVFEVSDTGIGIDPKHLPHIFDRFYRIPEKTIVDGSGIGLNLVKELVEHWGGHVDVKSPAHEDEAFPGTCFRVSLPIQKGMVLREGVNKNG